jgi:hypothetical protein
VRPVDLIKTQAVEPKLNLSATALSAWIFWTDLFMAVGLDSQPVRAGAEPAALLLSEPIAAMCDGQGEGVAQDATISLRMIAIR